LAHGQQERSAYNGYFNCTCYHPLFCFNQFGDVEGAPLLREGNVASAADWQRVLEPVVARYRDRKLRRYFRGDTASALPELYEFLEAENHRYAMRMPANDVLYEAIDYLLTRPVGRPPKRPVALHDSFEYQASSWSKPRRVVAKVEWHHGELFPRVGFIVTNLRWASWDLVAFYNQRGTAEQWIKEYKYALNWTLPEDTLPETVWQDRRKRRFSAGSAGPEHDESSPETPVSGRSHACSARCRALAWFRQAPSGGAGSHLGNPGQWLEGDDCV